MNRRDFLQTTGQGGAQMILAVAALGGSSGAVHAAPRPLRIDSFEYEEAGILQLQSAMSSGKETAVSLAKKYLRRIEEVDRSGPRLNSVIEVNPDALAMARGLDRERKQKGPRSSMHGIPILIKDNIDTHDRMMTTAGSLALVGSVPPRDSFVAQKLREAGAVILGKTNLSEWANFRGERSTSGWSGRGGQTKNPYVLDRNPSGSSAGSGAAVSANLCSAAIGTETNGSIVSPSCYCGIVGLKPTVGLISRSGIIPISHSQDTAGPMTRSVTDAAILLSALVGVDPRDAATRIHADRVPPDYMRFLDPNGLRGARIGIVRKLFRRENRAAKVMEAAFEVLRSAGAILVDPADLPSLGKEGDSEDQILHYEFKADLNAYLASLGSKAPVRTLKDIIEFNERNKEKELQFFGQETFIKAEAKGPLTDKVYLEALEKGQRLAREEGIDAVMAEHRLDAMVGPSGGPAHATDYVLGDRGSGGSSSPAAIAGYPNITVPAGEVMGLPVGLSFFGRAWSEPTLLKLAFAFEQATRARKVPRFLPTLG